jgi:hypothetical protein
MFFWKFIIALFLSFQHLEDCLAKFNIMNGCWGQSVDGNYSQVTFTVSAAEAEVIINHLQTVGIGSKYESSIW